MVLRVRTIMTGQLGAPYYSNLFYEGTGLTDATAAHAGVSALWNSLRTHMKTGTSISITSDVVEIDNLTGLIVTTYSIPQVTWTGNDATDMLPPANQALLRFRTGVYQGGREVRGRMFVPAQMEGDNVAGTLQVPYVSFLQGVLNTYLTSGSSTNRPCVYSPTYTSTARINAANPWSNWAILRSRRD